MFRFSDEMSDSGLPMHSSNEILTAQEVAQYLKVRRDYVYRKARTGEIPSIRLGKRKLRFRRSDIERWLEGKVHYAKDS